MWEFLIVLTIIQAIIIYKMDPSVLTSIKAGKITLGETFMVIVLLIPIIGTYVTFMLWSDENPQHSQKAWEVIGKVGDIEVKDLYLKIKEKFQLIKGWLQKVS